MVLRPGAMPIQIRLQPERLDRHLDGGALRDGDDGHWTNFRSGTRTSQVWEELASNSPSSRGGGSDVVAGVADGCMKPATQSW